MRARGRLQLLNLSGAPLPVAEWAGGSATLSLAQKRVHESDAVLLAELLQRHDALASLDLSQCRMSETATMRIVRALAAGGGPSRLAELKLADNRLRVGPSPSPHPRPRPRLSPCPRPSPTLREPQP